MDLPSEILTITKKVADAGFELYLVGGAVRDMLMGKEAKDFDFTTNATPEEIQKLYENSFYDNTFGTVGIPTENYGTVEITTYRSEKGYSDRRRPDEVNWGKSIEEDLQRRDFTINAMALPVIARNDDRSDAAIPSGSSRFAQDDNLLDPYNGQQDLKYQLIRAVGDPNQRFQEDALRMLRAIRFSAQLGFLIEEETLNAIKNKAALIKHISGERIRDELLKILASDFPYEGFIGLRSTGLLALILPELEMCFGVEQTGPNRHHIYDVGTHNFLALKTTPATDPVVRFATVLHDVGKPQTTGTDSRGNNTFYNHEVVGAKIARNIADRLHVSKKQREKIVTLVRWHQFSVDDMQTDSAVRRFIRNVGVDNIQDMLDLRIGDRLGSGIEEHNKEGWSLKKFKERIEKELHPPFAIRDLAIDGNDIMQELNLKPGPKIGEILQKLFEEADDDLSKNTREYLSERIKKLT